MNEYERDRHKATKWAPLIRINKLWLWGSCSYLVNACSIYHQKRKEYWSEIWIVHTHTQTQLRLCENCEFIMFLLYFIHISVSRWSMLPSLYYFFCIEQSLSCGLVAEIVFCIIIIILFHSNKEEPQKEMIFSAAAIIHKYSMNRIRFSLFSSFSFYIPLNFRPFFCVVSLCVP